MMSLSHRSVFLDKYSLFPRHIPTVLPHRENIFRMLHSLFDDFLKKPDRIYQGIVQIFGPIGSGKSCTAYRFEMDFKKACENRNIPLRVVHINCKVGVGSKYVLYQTVLQNLNPDLVTRGFSENETLRQILNFLQNSGEFLFLILDDVDYLVRKSKEKEGEEGGIIFDLTRLNEIFLGEYQKVVGVIFIARDASFKKLLDPSEKSTLGNVVIRLSSYSSEQLCDILEERVDKAFRLGTVEDNIVEFAAELSAGKTYNPGDCRFALDILLTAGLIADSEDAEEVSMKHLRKAASESFDGISSEDLLTLDENAILTLLAAVHALGFHKSPYVSLKSTWQYYLIECETRETNSLSYRQLREILKDLDFRGIVNYTARKGLSIVGASMEDLDRVLQTLERRRELEEDEQEGHL